jgi:hypothetical protein
MIQQAESVKRKVMCQYMTKPGQTALTRIVGARTRARDFVIVFKAPLEAA